MPSRIFTCVNITLVGIHVRHYCLHNFCAYCLHEYSHMSILPSLIIDVSLIFLNNSWNHSTDKSKSQFLASCVYPSSKCMSNFRAIISNSDLNIRHYLYTSNNNDCANNRLHITVIVYTLLVSLQCLLPASLVLVV